MSLNCISTPPNTKGDMHQAESPSFEQRCPGRREEKHRLQLLRTYFFLLVKAITYNWKKNKKKLYFDDI